MQNPYAVVLKLDNGLVENVNTYILQKYDEIIIDFTRESKVRNTPNTPKMHGRDNDRQHWFVTHLVPALINFLFAYFVRSFHVPSHETIPFSIRPVKQNPKGCICHFLSKTSPKFIQIPPPQKKKK